MTFRHPYFEAVGLDPAAMGEEDQKKCAAALERAHEIRKFEIELYWKRATYFWAFQAISFAGLGLSIKDGPSNNGIVLLGAAALGALTGFSGWLTAKGSKFWQENWEAHVEMLEEVVGEGRLTLVVICRDSPAFSVSRVNQHLIGLLTCGWLALLVLEACPWFMAQLAGFSEVHLATSLLVLVVFVWGWLFFRKRTLLRGRVFAGGATDWSPYAYRWYKKAKGPQLIWRDPVGGRPCSQGPP